MKQAEMEPFFIERESDEPVESKRFVFGLRRCEVGQFSGYHPSQGQLGNPSDSTHTFPIRDREGVLMACGSTEPMGRRLWSLCGASALPPSFRSARSVTSVPVTPAIFCRRYSYEPGLQRIPMALRATEMHEDAARDSTKPERR